MKNAVVWSEIAVSDLKRATAFYEKLLDGKLKAESFGPYELALFPHAADGIGGTPWPYCRLPVCGVRRPTGPTARTSAATPPT